MVRRVSLRHASLLSPRKASRVVITLLALFLTQRSRTSHAQTSDLLPVASNALPLPGLASRYVALQDAVPLDEQSAFGAHALQVTVRSGYLYRPLELQVPGAANAGLGVASVEHSLIAELGLYGVVGGGFEWGLSVGAVPWQTGSATMIVDGSSTSLAKSGTENPRLQLAWARTFGALSLRPFAGLSFALGTPAALTAESSTLFNFGFAAGYQLSSVGFTLESGMLCRPVTRSDSFAWGSQARLGIGSQVPVWPKVLQLGIEALVMPVLVQSAAQLPRQIPAEALASMTLLRPGWTIRLSGGSGLPLTQQLRPDKDRLVRGATSPVLRIGLDLTLALEQSR